MFLAKKSPRSYVRLYQKFLYKIFSLLLTPPPTPPPPLIIILKHPPMRQRLCLGQGAQCCVILKKLLPSAVVSAHFPNVLPTQRLENLCVSHQSQVTRHVLSYESVFFSSTNIPGDNSHCAKRFAIVREEGLAEGLFYKEPAPPTPEIQNSTSPPSAPGDPVEDGVFNASNQV